MANLGGILGSTGSLSTRWLRLLTSYGKVIAKVLFETFSINCDVCSSTKAEQYADMVVVFKAFSILILRACSFIRLSEL